MQLQRILALAAAAFVGSVSALDFSDTTEVANDSDENRMPNDEERIYGGTEADISNYPWTVSLRKTAEGSTYCGGTLVASQYIVTAAHCVKNTTFASIGSQFSKGTEGGERIKVTDQWIHPKYVKDSHVYDVAVMKLEKPSTFKTLPLCKEDGSQNKDNTMAVVRGWGMTESEVPATTLLEVNVKVISNAVCNKSYNNRITEQMMCAGQGGGKDTCQGDSGGALIANNALIGVVSWGGACGEAPGVYVRVTSVLDFINEKIGGAAPATPEAGTTAPTSPASSAPAATTTAPAATTAAPTATTAAPAATTAAPSATTAIPTVTTAAPAATTAAPAATTATPAMTTPKPSLTPATPATSSPSGSDDSDDGAVTPVPPSSNTASDANKGSTGAGGKKPKKDCRVKL